MYAGTAVSTIPIDRTEKKRYGINATTRRGVRPSPRILDRSTISGTRSFKGPKRGFLAGFSPRLVSIQTISIVRVTGSSWCAFSLGSARGKSVLRSSVPRRDRGRSRNRIREIGANGRRCIARVLYRFVAVRSVSRGFLHPFPTG